MFYPPEAKDPRESRLMAASAIIVVILICILKMLRVLMTHHDY